VSMWAATEPMAPMDDACSMNFLTIGTTHTCRTPSTASIGSSQLDHPTSLTVQLMVLLHFFWQPRRISYGKQNFGR
jgi:hypothetical protein